MLKDSVGGKCSEMRRVCRSRCSARESCLSGVFEAAQQVGIEGIEGVGGRNVRCEGRMCE